MDATGLRRRLAIEFAGVALVTAVVVTALTFLTSLYLVTNGATVVPPGLRTWVQQHLAHPGPVSLVAYAVLAIVILGVTVAVISSFATRRALAPLRELTEAAEPLAGAIYRSVSSQREMTSSPSLSNASMRWPRPSRTQLTNYGFSETEHGSISVANQMNGGGVFVATLSVPPA